jgi:hypothetical protein
MLAPATVATQLPEAQSPGFAQASPSFSRQFPPTSTRSGEQTQVPSGPQARPDCSQLASQQRLVPVVSSAQRPEVHCCETSQPVPVGRRSLQAPVSELHALGHSRTVSRPASQVFDLPPSHVARSPSHWTQTVPSEEQTAPDAAQSSAQHTSASASVGSHHPESHSEGDEQLTPTVNAQPVAPQTHSAPKRRSFGVQSASLRQVPYPRQRLTVTSSGKSLQTSSEGQSTGEHRASSRGASSQRPVASHVRHRPAQAESQQIVEPPEPTTQCPSPHSPSLVQG